MKRQWPLAVLFLFTVLTDQITKLYIDHTFALYDVKRIIPRLLVIRYIRNDGVAFGLHLGHPTVMLVLTIAVVVMLGYLLLRDKFLAGHLTGRIAVVLILGGAVGNLIDRIRMGEVIDFIQMGIGPYTWPVYNLADVYVTFGMIILVYIYLFKSESQGTHQPVADE